MARILDRMRESPLLFDGAMGTMIYDRGVFINTCFDELCLSNPKLVGQIHAEYVEAGADVIETNTFGANRIALRPYGLSEKVVDINRQAVRIAREVPRWKSPSPSRSERWSRRASTSSSWRRSPT
jgi:homocysteine S-methyltransferase